MPKETDAVSTCDWSNIWALCSSVWSLAAEALSRSCFSRAALYSAFSRRSPLAMAVPISLEFCGNLHLEEVPEGPLLALVAAAGDEQAAGHRLRLRRFAEELELGVLVLDLSA